MMLSSMSIRREVFLYFIAVLMLRPSSIGHDSRVLAAETAATTNGDGGGGICFMVYQMADNNLEEYIRQDNNELINSKLVKSTSTTTWIYFDARNFAITSTTSMGNSDTKYTNNKDNNDIISTPLRDIYEADGSKIQYSNNKKYQGSRYFTYDHTLSKMIVNTTFPKEQDSDRPTVLYKFAKHALTDCTSRGRSQFVFILSSHGVGIAGFGHDENIVGNYANTILNTQSTATVATSSESTKSLASSQRLTISSLQDNKQIITALQQALDDVQQSENVPAKYDMVGFDACIMNSYETLDEYSQISKYYIASEAIEPGHGWAYYKLEAPSQESVVELGKQIIDSFVDETQTNNRNNHQVPKTLSLIDTNKWSTFVLKFELLFEALHTLIETGNESILYESITRARNEAITIAGGLLDSNRKYPNSIDIGDFLLLLKDICQPNTNSLSNLLDETIDAYNEMFIYFRKGDGTPKRYTGMSIFWPKKDMYLMGKEGFERHVFNSTHPFYNSHSPNLMKFLDIYFNSRPQIEAGNVCGCITNTQSIDRDDIDDFNQDNVLLLNPKLRNLQQEDEDSSLLLEVSTQLSSSTDEARVEYGVDVTTYYIGTLQQQSQRHQGDDDGSRRRRHLRNVMIQSFQRRHDNGQLQRQRRRLHVGEEREDPIQQPENNSRQRQLQDNEEEGDDEDYLIFFGGNALVRYTCSGITATWDRQFYFLTQQYHPNNDDKSANNNEGLNRLEAIYVIDDGPYTKSIPVYYFPTITETIVTLLKETFLTMEEAKSLGGLYSILQFTIDPKTKLPIQQSLALYSESPSSMSDTTSTTGTSGDTTNTRGGAFAETPKTAKGYITPIVYVDGYVDGIVYDTVIGGLYGTLMEWKWGHNIRIVVNDTKSLFFDDFGSTTAMVNIQAWDYDKFYYNTGGGDGDIKNTNGIGQQGYDSYHWLLGEEELTATSSRGTTTRMDYFTMSTTIVGMLMMFSKIL